MKPFVIKIITLIMILSLFFTVLEFIVFPNNNNQMTLKRNLLISKSNTEVLVLGNSHTFFGVNPSISKFKMINIANKGRKLETDYYILKTYLNFFNNLKNVIIPISHYTLLAGELSSAGKRLYFRFFNINEYSQNFTNNYLLFNEPFRELVDGVFYNKKEYHKNIITKLGWRPMKGNYIKNINEVKQRVFQMEGDEDNYKNIEKNIKIIDSVIKLCKGLKLNLIFITPPYHKDYYGYSNKKYHRKIDSILNLISKKNEKVFYIMGDDLNIRENKYFINSDHLNTEEANLFTTKIDSILTSLF